MRRNIGIFLIFLAVSIAQIFWLNLVIIHMTFSVPLTLVLLLLPYYTRNQAIAAVAGAALPLDYTSALPFGSYLISFFILAFVSIQIIQRFPIRAHRLFHLALITGGSLLFSISLFIISSVVVALKLAPWSFAFDREIFRSTLQLLAWNTMLAAISMILARQAQRLIHRRFVLPHASP